MCLTDTVLETDSESDKMSSVNILFFSRLCVFKECLVHLFETSQ